MNDKKSPSGILSTAADPLSDTDFSSVEKQMIRFWRWNGDGSAPRFSHWTNQGEIMVRVLTPGVSSEVCWKPKDGEWRVLGHDDINPHWPISNIALGRYDKDAGVKLAEIIPSDLAQWNSWGG